MKIKGKVGTGVGSKIENEVGNELGNEDKNGVGNDLGNDLVSGNKSKLGNDLVSGNKGKLGNENGVNANGKTRSAHGNRSRVTVTLVVSVVASVTVAVLETLRIVFYGGECMIKSITGTPCPACGMTRAFFSLFRLDIASAFRYNPAFPAFPIALALVLASILKPDGKRLWYGLIFADVAAVLIVWVVRVSTGSIANAL